MFGTGMALVMGEGYLTCTYNSEICDIAIAFCAQCKNISLVCHVSILIKSVFVTIVTGLIIVIPHDDICCTVGPVLSVIYFIDNMSHDVQCMNNIYYWK